MPNILSDKEQVRLREVLSQYLPATSVLQIIDWMKSFNFQLRISKPRATKLGDYRPPQGKYTYHRISVNGDLNPYAFLTVLVHEIAHLETHERYGRRVKPHGKEWKQVYAHLMQGFLTQEVFPIELQAVLRESMNNPVASSCADINLMKALRSYDDRQLKYIEELKMNEQFVTSNGRVFERGEKLRKRYKCRELNSDRIYLFSPIAEVKLKE